MIARWAAAALILSAFVRAQSTPGPCPADRPVDDIIAELKWQKSKNNPQNKGSAPQTVCSWEWCTEPGRTPPIIAEPAPSAEVPSNGKNSSYKTPEECSDAMEKAKQAAHDVEVGDYSFERKNYTGALLRYRDAAGEKPGDPAIHVRLGRAFEKLNERPQAIEQYKAAEKLAASGKWSDEAHAALVRLQSPTDSGACTGKDDEVCYDPQYTDEAAKANVKGVVRLSAMVGADGCARDIEVVSSIGYGLDDAAVSALERFRFHKWPKPVRVNVEFNFDPQLSSRRPLTAPKCAELADTSAGKK